MLAPPTTTAAAPADTPADSPRPPASGRRLLVPTAVIGLCALAVRVVAVAAHSLSIGRTADAGDYQRLAVSLATGHGWGISHYAPGGGPTAFRPPLYPLFLASVYKVVGVHVTAARLAGAALGAVAVVLLVGCTAMLWSRRVALVAGALAVVFPPMVMASTALMSEALAVPLEIAALYGAIAYRRSGRLGWAIGAGAALGAAVLTRPNLAVLVVPVVALVLVRPLGRRALLAGLAVVVAGTALVVPWLVRDRVAFHQWVPITTQTGIVVAGTYNHTSATAPADRATWIPFTWDRQDATLMARHRRAGEIQTSSLLQSAAWRYARGHPGYAGEVVYQNTRHLFDLVPLHETRQSIAFSYGVPASWGDADAIGALAALVLAAAGVVLSRGRRIPAAYWSAPLLLWVTTALLQGMPRLRATLDPFLLQGAAVTLVAGWVAIRRRQVAAAMTAR